MIIRRAIFKKLHGHLDIDLTFKPDVNVLIGVNGSGKTAVLNAMSWLLSPASTQRGLSGAYLLSTLMFDEICVSYTLPPGETYNTVTAIRGPEAIKITATDAEDPFYLPVRFPLGSPESDMSFSRDPLPDSLARFIEDRRDNAVLRSLASLPGPLYLPLDRRWPEEREASAHTRLRQSTVAGHIPITDVVELADSRLRREYAETSNLNQTFRNNIITSLFAVDEDRPTGPVWTVEDLYEVKSQIDTALMNLGLHEARQASDETFEFLTTLANDIGGETVPANFTNHPNSGRWIEWILRGSSVAFRIQKLIPLIQAYESDRLKATRLSTAFLHSVNQFISDNGKQLKYLGEVGLSVELTSGQQINCRDLSSGELQLLTLFTFLYSRFDPEQEFAVFVDEPELSLHVAWQNHYVTNIREANPNAQFIIATHSPEIAGPAQSSIIDISPRTRANA